MIQPQPISTYSNEATTTQVMLRLVLFIIARTGLFLAVVAWIASQWWSLNGHISIAGYGGWGQILRPGIAVGIDPSIQRWGIRATPAEDTDIRQSAFDPRLAEELRTIDDGSFRSGLLGVTLTRISFINAVAVTVPHWLVVAFFAALNVALQFIYRKRMESEPCEN